MDLNYFGVEAAARAVLPGMVRRREGKVVFIASAMAVCGALLFFVVFFSWMENGWGKTTVSFIPLTPCHQNT